jgi:AAA+ superfamily predicted ATPase
MQELNHYVAAGYPVIYLITPEESRAELQILAVAKATKRKITIWSHTDGFFTPDQKHQEQVEDPIEALQKIKDAKEAGIWVFRDLHKYFDTPRVLRLLRDIAMSFKQKGQTLMMVSPVNKLPLDIEHDVTVVEFELPTYEEIKKVWDTIYTEYKAKIGEMNEDQHEEVITAAMGLTTIEAENAFAKALVARKDYPDPKPTISKLVLREKAQIVKKSGILEYFEAQESVSDIGGLENIKAFLAKRKQAFTKKAKDFGLPQPRGIVLAGLPGCGKSLSAKVASNIMGLPLIRFDMGRIFAGLVGASEQNMRTALNTIDAIGNCVVWVDEMEKAFAGMGGSGSNDSGVSQRVIGSFLSWMQDKKSPSFVVATVNRIENILDTMPELLRRGRFDEIFFVGLPSGEERTEILNIHIRKHKRNPKDFDLKQVVKSSEGFSGAELGEAVITGLYEAFGTDTELNADHILTGVKSTNPLSKSAATQLEHMAKWARENAAPASVIKAGDTSPVDVKNFRKMSL